MASPQLVTELLLAWSQGESSALEELMPLVHNELQRLAHYYMAGQRPGHTLQTTALVNEAYLRLVDCSRVRWQNRAHFFARFLAVDAAHLGGFCPLAGLSKARRGSATLKLGEQPRHFTNDSPDLVALDDALNTLGRHRSRKSQVIELRFFGGLTAEETAEVFESFAGYRAERLETC
jgi:DNA-directed RNA polymerase specialized sigma24 family protein